MAKPPDNSVERNKVGNVFGDGCRPYAIPMPEWPVVTGVEGRNSTMPASMDSQRVFDRQRPPEK